MTGHLGRLHKTVSTSNGAVLLNTYYAHDETNPDGSPKIEVLFNVTGRAAKPGDGLTCKAATSDLQVTAEAPQIPPSTALSNGVHPNPEVSLGDILQQVAEGLMLRPEIRAAMGMRQRRFADGRDAGASAADPSDDAGVAPCAADSGRAPEHFEDCVVGHRAQRRQGAGDLQGHCKGSKPVKSETGRLN